MLGVWEIPRPPQAGELGPDAASCGSHKLVRTRQSDAGILCFTPLGVLPGAAEGRLDFGTFGRSLLLSLCGPPGRRGCAPTPRPAARKW